MAQPTGLNNVPSDIRRDIWGRNGPQSRIIEVRLERKAQATFPSSSLLGVSRESRAQYTEDFSQLLVNGEAYVNVKKDIVYIPAPPLEHPGASAVVSEELLWSVVDAMTKFALEKVKHLAVDIGLCFNGEAGEPVDKIEFLTAFSSLQTITLVASRIAMNPNNQLRHTPQPGEPVGENYSLVEID
ncbi:hypothetical protein G7Y89_g186 [Cudoniella acicularis]|uniref:2EXR domain-containing protein n=1 Tax=Cudoniella acicularis TaxID=354080 RepID=A0A8H4RYJ4_9HELO|nr:hypothetical protein G7Y89_g186 [Cudoniella acicularis]